MKFLLERDRIVENTVSVGHPDAPIALDCYSTVICARCHPWSGRRRERRESFANVATRERTARAITWRCSDCTATARCAGAFIMHVHPHISRWYTLKRREHASTSIHTHSIPLLPRPRRRSRFIIIRKHACTMTRLCMHKREDCSRQSIFILRECLVIDDISYSREIVSRKLH